MRKKKSEGHDQKQKAIKKYLAIPDSVKNNLIAESGIDGFVSIINN